MYNQDWARFTKSEKTFLANNTINLLTERDFFKDNMAKQSRKKKTLM